MWLYKDLPVATILLKLKGKLLAILRLLMLEGRVLFYAKSAATVSEAGTFIRESSHTPIPSLGDRIITSPTFVTAKRLKIV